MAYIVVYHSDQESARRELKGAVIIGRSPECDLSIHDILLSRRHCRISPQGDTWIISDLGSKNGTRVGGDPAFEVKLCDGDVIRLGKTAIRFRSGAFVGPPGGKTPGIIRPADPFEALAGTIRDFTFQQSTISPNGIPLPSPRPAPKEPDAYSSDAVRQMVSELVSSSWDSIYENASRPDPVMPRSPIVGVARRKRAHEPRVDISLQAQPNAADQPLPLPPIQRTEPRLIVAGDGKEPSSSQAPRGKIPILVRSLATIFQWLAMVMLLWPRR
jgi:predicted component of type VI protein secretion system